ncbi:hypothetical protein ACHQM5_013739 [Ranunculus cassubicifolius]
MDRISFLPEAIQHHILSLLPVETATKTTLLSRQWRTIFPTLPTLNFHQYDPHINKLYPTLNFLTLIYSTLNHHHDNSDILNMNLTFCLGHQSTIVPHINEWISFAVNRNIHCLDLSMISSGDDTDTLPFCVFTCKTLTVLRLTCVVIKLPKIVRLPNLKTLKLVAVAFKDECDKERLFTGCPLLEDLWITGSTYGLRNLPNSSCSLKILRAEIRSSVDFRILNALFKNYPNLEALFLSVRTPYMATIMKPIQAQGLGRDGRLMRLIRTEIKLFGGSKDEFELVGNLLQNGPVMEKMHIVTSQQCDALCISKIIETFPRASANVKVFVRCS